MKRTDRRAVPKPVLSLVEGPLGIPSWVGPTHSSDAGQS